MNQMYNMFCQIEDGIIYQVDTMNKVQIGYTTQSYNDLKEVTTEYYDKLVELGAIVPPKTQDEINTELQNALTQSQQMNIEMMKMLEELKSKLGDNENESNTNGDKKAATATLPRKAGQRNSNGDGTNTGEK